MALPPPPNARWQDFRIDSPTFRLSPIEKPDMSPYLVHMTGKNEILSILDSRTINSCVPEARQAEWYEEEVVCFTESPLFAIDAFRYLRFPRWQADQRFGIGFSKERLVQQGVRPVFYFDNDILSLLCRIKENHDDDEIVNLINTIMPLMFPLGETHQKQGFMWEREWRYPHNDGFSFDYSDIEVICCPENEAEDILSKLGEHAENIDVVQAWHQYDDVTHFIESNKSRWDGRGYAGNARLSPEMQQFEAMKRDLNKLVAHEEYLEKLTKELQQVTDQKNNLAGELSDLEQHLILSGELECNAEECFECGHPFVEGEAVYDLERDNTTLYLCMGCFALYL